MTFANQFSEFSAAAAEINLKIGGQFSCFGGMITGLNIENMPGKRLVRAWRVANWEPGVYSIVKFEFNKINAMETKVILDHAGFPDEQREHLDQGWSEKSSRL